MRLSEQDVAAIQRAADRLDVANSPEENGDALLALLFLALGPIYGAAALAARGLPT